jgi:chromosome segregation ATPase
MTVRLESFRYVPRGLDGWGTRRLHFGELFTAVQGPNGTGKTPIMKGILQGLGHEVELPPDVVTRCEIAELTLMAGGRPIILSRRLEPDFEIRINDGSELIFQKQADYATWLAGLFHTEPRELTTKQDAPAGLYASVLLPSIWVDQDQGWTTDYWTPPHRNFLKDQRQEVIRYLVGLPPRHPFRQKTQFDQAKASLERAEKAIELQRFVVERLRANEELHEQEEPALVERRTRLREELTANSEAIEAIRSSVTFFDREITSLESERNELLGQHGGIAKRKGQLTLVLSELDGEEDILTANVQATDLLRQFCAREGCQMFLTSERSFGRSLLFLKDQIKDLKTSDRSLSRDADTIAKQIGGLDAALSAKRADRQSAVNASPHAEVMGKLNSLTRELVQVELRLAKVQQYALELKKFEHLLNQREQAAAAVAELRPGRGKTASAIDDVRRLLSDSIQQWLITLGTQNTRTANFDEDFVLYVDGGKFSLTTHQSGSTRTRIVLAFHAALLEVSLARGGNHPGWLLFDAPKQHELSQTDFDAYTSRLVLVAAKYPGRVQVVFSVADLKTQFEVGDEVWGPNFIFGANPRFLGPIEERA